jgi:hypothetical protein
MKWSWADQGTIRTFACKERVKPREPQSGQAVFWPTFEPSAPQMQV